MSFDIPKFIDGPICLFRIEGSFEGIKKVLYLFGDVHNDAQWQTKCNTYNALPITNAMYITLSRLSEKLPKNKNIDIFGEFHNNINIESYVDAPAMNNMYIVNFMTMLRTMKNEQTTLNKFQNMRFHYVDFRNYMTNILYVIVDQAVHFTQSEYFSIETLNKLKQLLTNVAHIMNIHRIIIMRANDIPFIDSIINSLETKQNELKTDPGDTQYQTISNYIQFLFEHSLHADIFNLMVTIKFLRKLITKFESVKLKCFLLDTILLLFLDYCDGLQTHISNSLELIDALINMNHVVTSTPFSGATDDEYIDNTRVMCDGIRGGISVIRNKFVATYALLMDMYFVKRFLDKKYIVDGIIYCGGYHVVRTIYFLVTHFNFNITHGCAGTTLTQTNIKTIHDELKHNIKNIIHDGTTILFKFIVGHPRQCIDMTGFPPDFS